MIRLHDILLEIIGTSKSARQKLDMLPVGKLFDDAKNIEGIFPKSKHSWSETIKSYETHKENQQLATINIQDIRITQPNIQANKVMNMLSKLDKLPPITVVEFPDGENVIHNAHHRLVANWALGNDKIKVNLVKVNNLQEEQISAPDVLYHFTTPENFVKILNSDMLKAHPKFNQISFTEDPDLWAFQEFPDSDQELGFRMAFETDSLPLVKPFVYQGAPGEFLEHEQEWRTTSGNITDIEDRILGSGTLELAALSYWKKYLMDNAPGHIFNRIEFI
jgi:hypothetical protein